MVSDATVCLFVAMHANRLPWCFGGAVHTVADRYMGARLSSPCTLVAKRTSGSLSERCIRSCRDFDDSEPYTLVLAMYHLHLLMHALPSASRCISAPINVHALGHFAARGFAVCRYRHDTVRISSSNTLSTLSGCRNTVLLSSPLEV